MKIPVAILAALAAFVALAPKAEAGTTCRRVTNDYIEVDGMLDDWKALRGVQASGSNADAGLEVRCAYDSAHLYLALRVRDDDLVRLRKHRANREDSVTVSLEAGGSKHRVTLRAFPGADHRTPVRTWNGRKVPRWVSVEDSGLRGGFALELAVPLSRLPGYAKGTPSIAADIAFVDVDGWNKPPERTVRYRGRLNLEGGNAVLKSFLSQTKLSRRDLRVDVMANVDDTRGAERVVAGGKVVAVLRDGFDYFQLPVAQPSDVMKVKVVDLEGRGQSYILVRYRERGNGGSRDIVGVWRYAGAGFQRIFAFEVRKQLGKRVVEATWKLVPRGSLRKGRRSKRGHDILIEAGKATGWDEDSWAEQPATDVKPILLPWDEQTSAVYWFDHGLVDGGDAKRK